ncbi:hypothetical protein J4Q44_G00354440 [Coregonus suidteri]|uniref:Trans-1,2-dihydrobenzene-1,2-diol dehydrogenase n=1 Tax=Coregonus suidteri TaxID=861788 RepID=A0AAN8KS97_9TELE
MKPPPGFLHANVLTRLNSSAVSVPGANSIFTCHSLVGESWVPVPGFFSAPALPRTSTADHLSLCYFSCPISWHCHSATRPNPSLHTSNIQMDQASQLRPKAQAQPLLPANHHLFNMATRWGLCGVGKISHDFSVAMKTLPPGDHQIVAVAARSLERAQEFAKKHSIPKAYGSYEELASDPEIDMVYLGVLHTEHWRVGLLVLQAGKNMLCEKPFAMNSRQVGDLIAASRKFNVFLMEAIWSRCFPLHREVRRLLAEDAIGEVKLVKAYFGSPQLHIPRSVEKELGGGALLDIGVYTLQFVLMVFNGERPESIHATGVLLNSGVDESMVVVMKFSRNRLAFCFFSIAVSLPNDATISGTKGTIRVLGPMHCPTTLEVNGKTTQYPLPEPSLPLNFTNSTGLRYEAEEVRQCLLKGLKESPRMPLSESALLTEIMDECMKQVGVVFNQDSQ